MRAIRALTRHRTRTQATGVERHRGRAAQDSRRLRPQSPQAASTFPPWIPQDTVRGHKQPRAAGGAWASHKEGLAPGRSYSATRPSGFLPSARWNGGHQPRIRSALPPTQVVLTCRRWGSSLPRAGHCPRRHLAHPIPFAAVDQPQCCHEVAAFRLRAAYRYPAKQQIMIWNLWLDISRRQRAA